MQIAESVYFTSPKHVEVKTAPLPALKEDQALVKTICSAVSAGSEMLVYRGEFPILKDAHDDLGSDLAYPLAYGYASVGIVEETGKSIDKAWIGRRVFAFQPHTSRFVTGISALIDIPDFVSNEDACFLPNMETAVNLVQDGAPILGERVLVFGQGVVGLLTASLLSEFPLEELVTVDPIEKRRLISQQIKSVISIQPDELRLDSDTGISLNTAYTQKKFDLTYELSGSPTALNQAIESTTFSGRVVIGSWYGRKQSHIDLGGFFHRSRIKLISSQVSTISPELSARWDKPRRFETAWKALERINPAKWITHRFPVHQAKNAYHLLDENPQECIQVIFEYPQ